MNVRKPFKVSFYLTLIMAVILMSQFHYDPPANPDSGGWGNFRLGLLQSLAQSPPIPTQLPVRGALNITSTATGIALALPSATTQPGVRNYVYQVRCMNYAPTASVITLYSSSATVASVVAYLNCPASMAAMGGEGIFNPPIVLAVNAALVVTASTTTGTGTNVYVNAQGYTAR